MVKELIFVEKEENKSFLVIVDELRKGSNSTKYLINSNQKK